MTAKADQRAAGMMEGLSLAARQSETDARRATEARRFREVEMMPPAAILGRAGGLDTREPTPGALDALAESIHALGLLEPLVVDALGCLLCGNHRLRAVRRLASKDPDRWEKIPVRRLDFIAQDEPARALAVEVAENEQRRAYTPAEVKALAVRLRAAGFRDKPGRPRKGEKAMLPALGAVVGKSKRALLYMLADEAAAPEKVQSCTVYQKAAARLARALERYATETTETPPAGWTDEQQKINADAVALRNLLRRNLGEK